MSASGDRRVRVALGVGAPRLRLLDWAREATASVARYPGRSLLTALGTVFGTTAFVATMGISSTLSQQVAESFDTRRATEVVVSPVQSDLDPSWQAPASLSRLRALTGVVSAGRRLHLGDMPVSRGIGGEREPFPVFGVDPGALAAIAPRLALGRQFDHFHEAHAARVVLLARPVADRLSIARVGVAVFIDDRAYTVAGIFDDVSRRTEVLQGVVIPARTAETLAGHATPAPRDVLVATAPGAAQLIGAQAALALRPGGPDALEVIAPPDPRTLRREIESNVTQSVLLLSLLAFVIGGVSIANAATASIATRVPEIGLRRALGARPAYIFAQLIGETTALGAIGGAVGVLVGVAIVAAVGIANTWSPILDLRLVGLAVAVSAGIGLLAGLLPAWRATRIPPVVALQR